MHDRRQRTATAGFLAANRHFALAVSGASANERVSVQTLFAMAVRSASSFVVRRYGCFALFT